MKTIRPFVPQEQEWMIVDNALFDYIMPSLSPNAWKVLCFILRKTEGWHKEWDGLSYTQIMQGTSIKSSATVSKAIKELLDQDYIKRVKPDEQWDSNLYALNLTLEIEVENGTTLENEADANSENEVEPTLDSEDTKEHLIKEQEKEKTDSPSLREQAENGEMTTETEIQVLCGFGRQGKAGVADPSQDIGQYVKFRDEVLQIFEDAGGDWGRTKKQRDARRDAIIRFANDMGDFDLECWRNSLHTCIVLGGVQPDNLACFFDTYKAGGNYQEMCRRRQNGGKGKSLVSIDPAPSCDIPDLPEPDPLLSWWQLQLALLNPAWQSARPVSKENGRLVVRIEQPGPRAHLSLPQRLQAAVRALDGVEELEVIA